MTEMERIKLAQEELEKALDTLRKNDHDMTPQERMECVNLIASLNDKISRLLEAL